MDVCKDSNNPTIPVSCSSILSTEKMNDKSTTARKGDNYNDVVRHLHAQHNSQVQFTFIDDLSSSNELSLYKLNVSAL